VLAVLVVCLASLSAVVRPLSSIGSYWICPCHRRNNGQLFCLPESGLDLSHFMSVVPGSELVKVANLIDYIKASQIMHLGQ
jgi:hypothetical protein